MCGESVSTIILNLFIIRSYSKETNAIFNVSFMVNLCTSAIAICLMGFSMVMISLAHACKYSIGLTSFIVFTFFICYTGKELTETVSTMR